MKILMLLFVYVVSSPFFVDINCQEPTYVNVFDEPQIIEIKQTLNKNACNNKFYVPFKLPKGTKGWIYSLTTITNHETINPKSVLFDSVVKLSKENKPEEIANFLTHNESKRSFNFYIMKNKTQAESFFNCGYYEYLEKHIDTKSRSSYVVNTQDETYFIGIENNKDLKKLNLKLEIVAIL